MDAITRLIIRIAHGDEILGLLGVLAVVAVILAVNNMEIPQ